MGQNPHLAVEAINSEIVMVAKVTLFGFWFGFGCTVAPTRLGKRVVPRLRESRLLDLDDCEQAYFTKNMYSIESF